LKRRFLAFTAVIVLLVASVGIRCAVDIESDRALYRTYPMADGVEQAARIRGTRAREVREAGKLLGFLALIAVPAGILLARREL
jgi:hypothetical protein